MLCSCCFFVSEHDFEGMKEVMMMHGNCQGDMKRRLLKEEKSVNQDQGLSIPETDGRWIDWYFLEDMKAVKGNELMKRVKGEQMIEMDVDLILQEGHQEMTLYYLVNLGLDEWHKNEEEEGM